MGIYAIIRVEKCHMGDIVRINKHHEREKEEYKSNPDIDRSKSHLNYHLVTPTKSYRKMVLERIKAAGARRKKNSVVMQDGLITATPDWLKGKTEEEQRAFFVYAFQFVRKRYRDENILSAVVHLDEATPHLHFVFVPITEDDRLCSKDIIGGPKGMTQLQGDFYEYMHERYGELERGTPKRVSHRKHIPSYLFKNANLLYDHYEEICAAIQNIGLIGASKKKDEAIALLGRYAPEMAMMSEQLKTTDKHIRSLERLFEIERGNAAHYKRESAEKDLTIQEQNQELYDLNRKQKELEKVISQIPPEVLERIRQEELQARKQRQKGWDR